MSMFRSSSALGLCAALVLGSAFAGECNTTLTVTPDGTVSSGATVSIDVSGAPTGGITFLAAGSTLGSTSFTFGFASATLGLAQPFALLPLGQGDVSASFELGEVPAELAGTTIHLQALAIGLTFGGGPPSMNACVSNLDSLSF